KRAAFEPPLPRGQVREDVPARQGREEIFLRGGVPHERLKVRLLARELFERGNHLLEFRRRDRAGRREGHPRHLADAIPEGGESGHGGRPSIASGGIDRNQESLGHELLAFGWLDRGLLAVLYHLEDRTGPIALHI